MTATQPSTDADARYKFVVSSADEAVSVLRERLGENAKVISVRQIEGAGLARFLRAPKLEIIAKVEVPEPEAKPESDLGDLIAQQLEEPVTDLAPMPAAVLVDEKTEKIPVEEKLTRILLRAGFNEGMIARIRQLASWEKLVKLPLGPALTEISVILRGDYMRMPRTPLYNSVAFIGTPGAGKTTALCKRLSMDVFFRNRRARVLKLDLDRPNPNDGLAAFCEAMGVPLVRDSADAMDGHPDETLYIDFPGISADNSSDIAELSYALNSHLVVGRVLVVNAAYDSELIKRAYTFGEELGATHVVFSHIDELMHWGKLWEFVLGQRLQPLFLSAGQNLAGDFSEQIFDSILERTFPANGAKPAELKNAT
jgi:flagellar biosynthesis protein FlhF